MTSYRIKLVAIAAMTLDHAAKILGQPLLPLMPPEAYGAAYWAVAALIWIGRVAFPLFAFMIAEGCRRTRSMPRYAGRLALFAVISQPFYYMAFHGSEHAGLERAWQALLSLARLELDNVFVTLALGAAAAWAWQSLRARPQKWMACLAAPALAAASMAAELLHSDYGAFGVCLVFALRVCPGPRLQAAALAAWAAAFDLGQAAWDGASFRWLQSQAACAIYVVSWVSASAAAWPALSYNGQRGRPLKWVFYVYYPAHLFALVAIQSLALR
jgi:hypothetical protein